MAVQTKDKQAREGVHLYRETIAAKNRVARYKTGRSFVEFVQGNFRLQVLMDGARGVLRSSCNKIMRCFNWSFNIVESVKHVVNLLKAC